MSLATWLMIGGLLMILVGIVVLAVADDCKRRAEVRAYGTREARGLYEEPVRTSLRPPRLAERPQEPRSWPEA